MKIPSADAMRAWESADTARAGIQSIDLMERAAAAAADWLAERVPADVPVVVVCGCGGNGGDGLALTRILHERGFGVQAIVLRYKNALTPDTQTNLERLRALDADLVQEGTPPALLAGLPSEAIVVDALLGIGAARPAEGWLAAWMEKLATLPNIRVALDLPSGLPADSTPTGPVIPAHYTLTFGAYKRALLHPEGGSLAGEVHVLDIRLDEETLREQPGHFHTFGQADAAALYRPRDPFSHKGTHGTALVIGGGHSMVGALALAARAAGRAGAGKVRALVPRCGYNIIQTLVPEALCAVSGEDALEDFSGWEEAKGIGIGPGMSTGAETAAALHRQLDACTKPIVLDAGALTILAANKDWLRTVPPGSILTPHPKEFDRLFGEHADTFARTDAARDAAIRHNVHVILKGRHTVIATPGGACWYNLAGNAGLATGGSGDVLCGVITGLLSSGYDPCRAAMLGVYLHAAAGDAAAQRWGAEAMVAGDIGEALGEAFATLR